ncbi:MAG: UDP-3-O-(3-hydroxymyristoyl)glucosamine N-acyltransferase [Rhodospirillales bacterium]|nr:UDP-3-O-(3-hydroxymyristoyl)glucosamine N-acyltransferase [Rhodospirillales bacterium]MBO6786742.1 UDP-3-O-(3-hydroxymyristoyl)glucosamine N-acyltransferase [Rhodospirillales bacterium]
MADPRFFSNAGPFSLARIAETAGADVVNADDTAVVFADVMPLDQAGATDVSFLDNRKYTESFRRSGAGACIVAPDVVDQAPDGMALLVTPEPYHAYARVAAMFYPMPSSNGSIHPTAVVGDNASVGSDVEIGPCAVVGAGAEIGDGSIVSPGAVIGDGVQIGENVWIGANATILNAKIGAHSIIHAGVRIGQDGFGFAMGPGGHVKVPQLGRVIVGANVEIGANTTIDRGTGPDTVIGDGTKIDNLVQIAHNVQIGQNCVIVSQVGISGSTELGDFVVLAGQVGLAGHLKIGSGARIAAQSGVMRNVEPGQEQGGSPAKPVRKWLKEVAMIERMASKKGG